MRTLYMNEVQVKRTLDRLAHEIIERNRGVEKLVVIGILRTGATLARRLVERINAIEKSAIQSIELDVTAFRDDQPYQLAETSLPDLTDKAVLLVDDVLFTGRTARAALDAVVRSGRPASIQLLALIDRGHREYPIQPDYVGRIMPTKHKERVEVDPSVLIVDIVE